MLFILIILPVNSKFALAMQVLLELVYIFAHKARFVLFLYPFVNILSFERITLGVRQHWLPWNIFRRIPSLAFKYPEKVKSWFPELEVVLSNPILAPTASLFAVPLYSDYNRRWKSNWIVNAGHLTQDHPF